MKRGIAFAITLGLVFTLTGCVDAMPDMSKEENAMIAEYSASLLMKYSPNFHNRLVDDDELERALFEEQREQLLEEAKEEEKVEESQDTPKQEETNNTEADNTKSETIEVETVLENLMPDARQTDIAPLLEVSGVEIVYQDYELTNTYPKNELGFTVTSSKDNKLLVLHFSLTNVSGDKLLCDMFTLNPSIKVDVNGSGFRKIDSTILMNDITTYYEELPANQTVDVVAILEISDSAIESLDIQIGSTELFVE